MSLELAQIVERFVSGLEMCRREGRIAAACGVPAWRLPYEKGWRRREWAVGYAEYMRIETAPLLLKSAEDVMEGDVDDVRAPQDNRKQPDGC